MSIVEHQDALSAAAEIPRDMMLLKIENESFIIIIESIGQEISLMSIFPTSLNVSLILFELKQITQKLLGIFNSEEQTEVNAKISSTI